MSTQLLTHGSTWVASSPAVQERRPVSARQSTPISFIPVDLTINARALTNCLRPVEPTLLRWDQYGFVKGRHIQHPLLAMHDLQDLTTDLDADAYAMLIDFEKRTIRGFVVHMTRTSALVFVACRSCTQPRQCSSTSMGTCSTLSRHCAVSRRAIRTLHCLPPHYFLQG